MPGVVNMENGDQNGVRTNHDREIQLNGVNGAKPNGSQNILDKGKTASSQDGVANGGGPESNGSQQVPPSQLRRNDGPPRMNDLPDEIVHITQGFIPLSRFLTRLAQTTHNSLQEKVAELVKMPIPPNALNGNATTSNGASDDISAENLRKKAALLTFAQDVHAKWVKALVITEWSRKAEMVSKLIDLKFHIDQQRIFYDAALDNIVNVKRDLTYARMPSPDLKTALQVLSTGTAPWMPDLNYIEIPALIPGEQNKWVNDLNTLLSLRLNLEDFDKVPYHFRNYEIDSGRVTFKVLGEFEVDLTIADDDFDKQFWFIDFRFAFQPAAETVPESLKRYLEGYVNDALGKDGLSGCYQFLHEFVLTHKLNELKRQALQLSQTSWTGTLKVEALNRALAIQYWTSRTPPTSPKSWVLIAANSGRKSCGRVDKKSTSFLTAKWYRDNKEVKDSEIPLDVDNISAESLLKAVVGRHIDHILTSIHDKLQGAPRFRDRQARMALRVSQGDPAASALAVHVGYNDKISLLMQPTTGLFAIKPHSKITNFWEHQLNSGRNPAEDGVHCLENIRCAFMEDELNRRGNLRGWSTGKCPFSNEELRSVVKARDVTKTLWLRRGGWGENWFVMVLLGLGSDEWWLLEANRNARPPGPRFQARLPMNKGYPLLSDSFWNNLTLFTSGMIAQSIDLREFHRHHVRSRSSEARSWSLPQQVRLPSIEIALSAVFPSMVLESAERGPAHGANGQSSVVEANNELGSVVRPLIATAISAKQPWANDVVSIRFKGVLPLSKKSTPSEEAAQDPPLICLSDAVIKVRKPAKFTSLKDMDGPDVAYNTLKGEFCLRIRHAIGTSIFETLKSRIKAVDRFVNFMESMEKAKGTITDKEVALKKVAFCYGEPLRAASENDESPLPSWRIELDLSQDNIDIRLQKGNPHLRVADLMRNLVNSDGGIQALMGWLPTSLPAFTAIERIETAWEDIQERRQGYVELSIKTIDWMSIRYVLPGPDPMGLHVNRQLILDIKIRSRRGELWWNIYRINNPGTSHDDEFTTALKPIWEGKGGGWHGLTTSAAGTPTMGIVNLLAAIDEAVRALVGAEVTFMIDFTTTQGSSSQSMQSFTQPTPMTQHSQASGNGGPQVVVLD